MFSTIPIIRSSGSSNQDTIAWYPQTDPQLLDGASHSPVGHVSRESPIVSSELKRETDGDSEEPINCMAQYKTGKQGFYQCNWDVLSRYSDESGDESARTRRTRSTFRPIDYLLINKIVENIDWQGKRRAEERREDSPALSHQGLRQD